jgi:hypothetical protein
MINKIQIMIIVSAIVILFIPFSIEMLDGGANVKWSFFDFILAFFLLVGIGFSFEFLFRKIKTKPMKIIVITLVLLAFFLLWAELAVGVFNSPIAGN